jgi:hypothetical protein
MKNIIIFLSILLISACGGGSGGSNTTTTDPNKLFSTAVFQSTTPGTVYTNNTTGSDTNGGHYIGSISIVNRPQTMLNGVLVTPRDILVSLSNSVSPIIISSTIYLDVSGNLISRVKRTTGATCAPVTPDKYPDFVKIGDSGTLSTEVCDDNTTTERNWRVEDAGNGNINFINNETVKDNLNVITTTLEKTDTIDGNGNLISSKLVVTTIATNYTLTIQTI